MAFLPSLTHLVCCNKLETSVAPENFGISSCLEEPSHGLEEWEGRLLWPETARRSSKTAHGDQPLNIARGRLHYLPPLSHVGHEARHRSPGSLSCELASLESVAREFLSLLHASRAVIRRSVDLRVRLWDVGRRLLDRRGSRCQKRSSVTSHLGFEPFSCCHQGRS